MEYVEYILTNQINDEIIYTCFVKMIRPFNSNAYPTYV